MRGSSVKRFLPLAMCLLGLSIGAPGCTPEEPVSGTGPITRATPTPKASGLGGGISTDGAMPAPSADPTPAPTPLPGVTALVVTPLAVTGFEALYPPAVDQDASMGHPSSVQLSGHTVLSDGSTGSVRWESSSSALAVSTTGAVSVTAEAAPGIAYIRAIAVDDEHQYQDVPVEVKTTGQIDATID